MTSVQRSETTLSLIVTFLNEIGIETIEGIVPESSFLPGVRIAGGRLVYQSTLPWPGDLLHEAGHIATAPTSLRSSLCDGVELPESVEFASEVEATAWAFAALRHLALPPEVLFHPDGYHGASKRLIDTFMAGVYPGAFGLAKAGMTDIGPEAGISGAKAYPHMKRWLRS